MDESRFKSAKRLVELLMPYASQRRKECIERSGNFVHYTSAENAINIIKSKKLWMRNARCMNDYMELSHGYGKLLDLFRNDDRKKKFIDAIESAYPGSSNKALKLFDEWWNKIQFNTYISSISEHNLDENDHGRLSMWRAYGKASSRAALIFNIPIEQDRPLGPLNIFFSPVAYFCDKRFEDEISTIANNIIENIEFIRSIDEEMFIKSLFLTLVMAAISLKHEGFKEEKEWRIIYLPDIFPSDLMFSDIEVVDGVPQRIFKIALEDNPAYGIETINIPKLVERIIVGPSNYPIAISEAFGTVLAEAGVENSMERVTFSGIPLRT